MATETPSWERFKENAAPLQRGRNVADLERSVVETAEDREAKESAMHHFENLVRPSEETAANGEQLGQDADPLIHWQSYIKFHQDNFPSDKQSVFLLMERCTRSLLGQTKYANDPRFIRICAMYADQTADAGEIFRYLHSQKVGQMTALFWIAWAFCAEKQGDYPFAEKIFKKGISKKARPQNVLEQRHRQFQRRMARHWMNAAQNKTDDDENEDEDGGRGVLGNLSEDGFRRNDRSSARNHTRMRSNQPQRGQNRLYDRTSTFIDRSAQDRHRRDLPPSNRQNQNGQKGNATASTGFHIFQDGQENDGYDLDRPALRNTSRQLPREEDRLKENTLVPEPWNQRGGLHATSHHQSRSHATRPLANKPSEFPVFVDEECAVENQREELQQQVDEDRKRRHRDERTFRPLEAGASVVEKLSQDPLRYLKDPSRKERDEKKAMHSQVPPENSSRKHKSQRDAAKKAKKREVYAFDQALIGKDSNGQEQCFNEQRALRGHFTLVSSESDFNRLATSIGSNKVDDSGMDIDDNITAGELSVDERSMNNASFRSQKKESSRRVLFSENTSFEVRNRSINVSQCSSTVNEANAVGIYEPEEETINTKLAIKEMSMMFCSPAAGLTTTSNRKAKRSKTESEVFMPAFGQTSFESQRGDHQDGGDSDGETADFEAVLDLVGSCDLNANNSILQPEKMDNENQGPKNPQARTASSQDEIDKQALRPLKEDTSISNPTSCRETRRAFGTIAQEDPFARAGVTTIHDDPGFTIFEEQAESDNAPALQNGRDRKPSFEIHEDKPGPTFPIFEQSSCTDQQAAAGHTSAPKTAPGGFSIFEDETGPPQGKLSSVAKPAPGGFPIFEDNTKPAPVSKKPPLVEKHNVAKKPAPGGFTIFEDKMLAPTSKAPPDTKPASDGFQIFVDEASPKSNNQEASSDGDDGDTATLSLFGGLMNTVFEDVDQSSDNPQGSNCDPKGTTITDPQSFGDISVIDNVSLAPNRNIIASPTITMNFNISDAVDYHKTHRENLRSAMRRLKEAASGSVEQHPSLIKILAAKTVYEANHVLPRVFKKKLVEKGSDIKIGCTKGIVKRELGRGAYGVVVLLDVDDSGCSETMAVKAQSSTESLAHEYEILKKIDERIEPRYRGQQNPYPEPKSFVAFVDGGIMSMSAASDSGLNLVDLVNAYQANSWKIDDLIALHYMGRMLHHLELLHWHAKILHCDVKPDNWVLSSSNAVTVDGTELMLVDFGRSVDLSELAHDSVDALDVKLVGDAAEPDMMCVTMRNNHCWSYEADTFGVCASVHVLLFGTHLEIAQNTNRRWMPRQSFKRYWQRDLWMELFDTLLNSDEGTTIGSRPRTLRALRVKIESCLDIHRAKLDELLRRQEQILWATRPQLPPKRKR